MYTIVFSRVPFISCIFHVNVWVCDCSVSWRRQTSEQRPPLYKDHFWLHPWVVVVHKFSCIHLHSLSWRWPAILFGSLYFFAGANCQPCYYYMPIRHIMSWHCPSVCPSIRPSVRPKTLCFCTITQKVLQLSSSNLVYSFRIGPWRTLFILGSWPEFSR